MADGIRVEIEGIKEAQRKFSSLSEKAQRQVLRSALRSAVRPVVNEARANVDVRSGQGKKDITSSVSVKKSYAEASVGFRKRSWYLQFQELGAGAHTIVPKSKKVLANKARIFGRKVRHPGRAARPFLRPALDNRKGDIIRAFGDAVKAQIDRMAKRGR